MATAFKSDVEDLRSVINSDSGSREPDDLLWINRWNIAWW